MDDHIPLWLAHLHLEARCLDRQQVFYVSAAAEYSLQIHPSSLYINPHIEAVVYTIQLV